MTDLSPEEMSALMNWIGTIMSEREGQGKIQVNVKGEKEIESWDVAALFQEINRQAPDAIARMFQAGAGNYFGTPACWR